MSDNPHFKWNRRKQKRRIKSLAKKLIPNKTYVLGCRGHPGLLVKKEYFGDWKLGDLMGSDVEIKSLVDGCEESCSIYHCVPTIITKAEAEELAEAFRTMHSFDVAISIHGANPTEYRELWDSWVAEGRQYYVLTDMDGSVVRSPNVMTKDEARDEVLRLMRIDPAFNPRIVDFRTYPAAPTLIGI